MASKMQTTFPNTTMFHQVILLPFALFSAQSFHLPADGSVPVILVGNGTGIAPFRAFWQQRMFDINNKCPPESSITGRRQWGDMRLFFGCRNSRLDDIYRHELEKAVHGRAMTSVATAYSREEGKPKVYSLHGLFKNLLQSPSSFGVLQTGGTLRVVSNFGVSGEIHARARKWARARRRATRGGGGGARNCQN